MTSKEDSFTQFDEVLSQAVAGDPWAHEHGEPPVYAPDYELIGKILTVPVRACRLPA